ncbi:MAG: hypothetical protein WC373_10465 [Smithella sp.]|jgi:hypothetical protein
MIELFYSSIDEESIKKHVEMKKDLMRSYMTLDANESSALIEQYRELLNSHRIAMRKLLFKDMDKKVTKLKKQR